MLFPLIHAIKRFRLASFGVARTTPTCPAPPTESLDEAEGLQKITEFDVDRPRWLVVANIVETRPWGPGGLEQRRGVRQFKAGAKVTVVALWRNASPEVVTVVGHHRMSNRYATVILKTETLSKLRVQLVRSPHILRELNPSRSQLHNYEAGTKEIAEQVMLMLSKCAASDQETESAASSTGHRHGEQGHAEEPMHRDVTRLWTEAGTQIASNFVALVPCPECGRDLLRVTDRRGAETPETVEREMRCPSCGAVNFLRLTRPPSDNGPSRA